MRRFFAGGLSALVALGLLFGSTGAAHAASTFGITATLGDPISLGDPIVEYPDIPLIDTVAPTISNFSITNAAKWGSSYQILAQPKHISEATGHTVVGGTVQMGASYTDNETLTNVIAYLPGRGFFGDSEFSPLPTNNATWNPVPQGHYDITWDTKAGVDWRAVTDGNYQFKFQARDHGTWDGTTWVQNYAEESLTVTIDNTAPSVEFIGATPAEGARVSGAIKVQGHFSDANGLMNTDIGVHTIEWVCHTDWPDGLDMKKGCEVDTTKYPDGPYKLVMQGRDKAGNETQVYRNIIIDNVSPDKPVHLTPASLSFAQPSATQHFDWSDVPSDEGVGTKNIYVFRATYNDSGCHTVDGMLVDPVVYQKTATSDFSMSTEEGMYCWQVATLAEGGKMSDWTTPWVLYVDATPPSLPVHLWPASGAVMQSAALTHIDWTDSEDTLPVPWADALASNVHYFYESSLSPNTQEDGSFTTPIYVSGALTTSQIPTPGTPEGTYFWHVRAVDEAGNSTQWTSAWTVTVDDTAPLPPNLIAPVDGSLHDGSSITFGALSSAAVTRFEFEFCAVDPGDEGAACENIIATAQEETGAHVMSNPSSGHFWWRARVKDAAGNWSGWSTSFELTVDADRPVVTLSTPAVGSGGLTSVTLTALDSGTGLSAAQYRVSVAGSAFDSWTSVTTNSSGQASIILGPLDPGLYTVQGRALDLAGNESDIAAKEFAVIAPTPSPTPTPSPSPVAVASTPTPTTTPVPTPTATPGTGGQQGSGGASTPSPTPDVRANQSEVTPPTPTPSIAPESGEVQGTSTTGSWTDRWYWLLLGLLAFFFLWFFIAKRRREEEQNR